MDSLLHKLYYNTKTGFISAQKLYQKTKSLKKDSTHKIVREWFAKQKDIQEHQDERKRIDRFKIASMNPNSWQMDLAFSKTLHI